MRKLWFTVLAAAILALSIAPAFAQEGWQANKFQWEKLVQDKDNVTKIEGGDLNGDAKDDVILVYNSASTRSIVALISKGDTYIPVSYDSFSSDIISKAYLAEVKKVSVEDGAIVALLDYDVSKIIPKLSGIKTVELKLKYLENKIKLTDLITTGDINGRIAQVFYNVWEGNVYYYYLQQNEKVGENYGYYYVNYSRVIAPKLAKPFQPDCDINKWVLAARAQVLKNNSTGSNISYGFERWTSDYDLSGKYYLAYDPANIYIHVQVNDDQFRQNFTGDRALRGDHIELWFADANGNKYQLALTPGNFGENKPEALLWYQQDAPVVNRKLKDVKVQSRKTSSGYMLEAQIPTPSFGVESVKGLTKFTMVLSDSDNADKQEKILTSSSLTWGKEYSLGEIIWK